MNNETTDGGAAVPCIFLLALSDSFAGRASQCTNVAQWCDLNAEREIGAALRDIAAYLRDRADQIRANSVLGRNDPPNSGGCDNNG